MSAAVPERVRSDRSAWASEVAARARCLEGVAVDGVASHPAVLDSDAQPSYSDRVQHGSQSRWTEAERQAFLARAQRVDPRERRP